MKKKRGIRKPKGYIPGDFGNNLYVAGQEYIKGGNNLVCNEAVQFFGDCKTFSQLRKLSLTKNNEIIQGEFPGHRHRVKSDGYDNLLMQFYGMKKSQVDTFHHSIAFDICEQILWAVRTGNDRFFRDLGRLCKFEKHRPSHPKIPLESWLCHVHQDFSQTWKAIGDPLQNRFFSAPELCELAYARGIKFGQDEKIPIRRMHEICKKLGINLVDGRKEGETSNFQKFLKQIKSREPVVINLPRSSKKSKRDNRRFSN